MSRTAFHASLWHCPTITGNDDGSVGTSLMAFTNAQFLVRVIMRVVAGVHTWAGTVCGSWRGASD